MQGLSFSLYIFRCKGVHSSPLIPSSWITDTTLTMGPGRGQTSVLNDEDRASPSTPPAYEFQLLVYVQQNVGCLKISLRNLFVLQAFFKKPRVINSIAFFTHQSSQPSDTIVIQFYSSLVSVLHMKLLIGSS